MKGLEVIQKLVTIQHKFCHGKLERDALARQLRKLADAVESEAAPKPKKKKDWSSEWQDVFEHWKEETAKPRAKPTAERKAKVVARLEDGYTVEQIKSACRAIMKSKHHTDGNYLDLTLICRNGSHLEKWIQNDGDDLENVGAMLRAMKGGSGESYADAVGKLGRK